MSLISKSCKYINEGNVHIVLQVTNTDYVIRIIKENENSTDKDTVSDSVQFVNHIMIPLILGSNKYHHEVIILSPEDIKDFSVFLNKVRPKHRQVKSVFSLYAIKAPNLTIISNSENYCIELKPKEGFLSQTFQTCAKCYYCLKQYVKLNKKKITHPSDYCPLDLFSGDKMRMKRALKNLMKNPQNNLKLFKDGKIVCDETSNLKCFENFITSKIFNSFNIFLDFIIEILLSNGNSIIHLQESPEIYKNEKRKYCIEGTNHNAKNFLNQLLAVQKMADFIQTDTINTNEDLEYVSKLIKDMKEENVDLTNEKDKSKFLSSMEPNYLAILSAVAKDCSIMISFSQQPNEQFPFVIFGDTSIYYRVSVTDLEPKSIQTLAKRKKFEKTLLEIYESLHLNTKMCKIQPHSETRAKQLEEWQQLITEYLKSTKQSTIDIRESQNSPLFNNASINRKLSPEAILSIFEEMAKAGKAAPRDKSKNVWEIYWHSLDEWGNMIYHWASCNGLNNSVCTLFELREGDNSVGQEFYGLEMNILIKALKSLEVKGKCELMEFGDNQGVKFF